MQERLSEENQIKVFILFIMKRVDCPLTIDELSGIMERSGYNGYFIFADVFEELVASGAITNLTEGGLFVISERGVMIADNLVQLLPIKLRERALAAAVRFENTERLGIRADSALTAEDNAYRLTCAFGSRLRVELLLKDEPLAEKMRRNFDERPEAIYKGIYALLAGDVNFIFE